MLATTALPNVMPVIRTSDSKIRWMNMTEYLQRRSTVSEPVNQIVFDGEPLTANSLREMRDRLMPPTS
jgi:hypothetical protein